MEKEKNASKEALDAAALAEFFSAPSWWQARTVLLVFGIPRNNSNGPEHSMNPGYEAQAPIGCIQANNTGTDLIEVHGSCQ